MLEQNKWGKRLKWNIIWNKGKRKECVAKSCKQFVKANGGWKKNYSKDKARIAKNVAGHAKKVVGLWQNLKKYKRGQPWTSPNIVCTPFTSRQSPEAVSSDPWEPSLASNFRHWDNLWAVSSDAVSYWPVLKYLKTGMGTNRYQVFSVERGLACTCYQSQALIITHQ